MTHHELLFGQKPGALSKDLINVNSKNDFPTLGTGLAVDSKNQAWGKNIFEPNAPQTKPQLGQSKNQPVLEAFPTLPVSKSIFSTQKPTPAPKEVKPEAPKLKSIFEEQKFEMAKPKDDEVIIKKTGKKGKGKPVAVEVKGNFY